MPYTEKKLKQLGFGGDFAEPTFSPSASKDGVELSCRHEEYDGRTVERWDLARAGIEYEPAATDRLHRLNALWKASSKAAERSPRPSPPPVVRAKRTATRDTAWDKLLDTWEGKKTPDELNEIWQRLLDDRGKPESEFTAADWTAVEESADVPF